MDHLGGCTCGNIRFRVSAAPLRVTFCHCRFCQRATGAAYAVEPIFSESDFEMVTGNARTYTHVSEGSGKEIDVHFCGNCGTTFRYVLYRFPGVTGLLAGTFDDPNWFDCDLDTTKHIFLSAARPETIVPAQMPLYSHHAITNDDTAITPIEINTPMRAGDIEGI
ncbi:MAG: GFA family protein [Boseongicola sp.]